ncbi:class I SAM-dependent methyltransferase [Streptomyces ficellus]|uniref:Class I SAM-dependent methyltransferase n=1 Tax=Streptomyces ficellus TaxID=1977088 RepID=A0A6I6FKW4_9ACTN|nr:class I SAM-dependent methyltransferase [Streptomyces ficellus]QGV82087.1 class I SAM-dependent methyltransferase [Streptomyces ficellus]
MFTPHGPTLGELANQALSSTQTGYDLLAPKFDHTPYRTPDRLLGAVADTLRPLGPFRAGLDVCCGTGAGVGVLRELCHERVTGVDFSTGMLHRARAAHAGAPGGPAEVTWVRADARALPFRASFDLAVSFGAFGHFLPAERPRLFAGVHRALRPGGRFVFPLPAPPPVGSRAYWELWAFDAAMRVRNLLWRPRFIMYYRTFRLTDVLTELTGAGFTVELSPLEEFGRRSDGSPYCRTVTAHRG